MDLKQEEEEDHISPQVTFSSSSSSSLTLCLSLLLLARISSARLFPWTRKHSRTLRPGTGTWRIRVPAAGSRHAGRGEDGRPRGSGLERILQRGGRSHSARNTAHFTAAVRTKIRVTWSGSGPHRNGFNHKTLQNFLQEVIEKLSFCSRVI